MDEKDSIDINAPEDVSPVEIDRLKTPLAEYKPTKLSRIGFVAVFIGSTRQLLPLVVTKFRSGELIPIGHITLNQQGMIHNEDGWSLPWNQIVFNVITVIRQ